MNYHDKWQAPIKSSNFLGESGAREKQRREERRYVCEQAQVCTQNFPTDFLFKSTTNAALIQTCKNKNKSSHKTETGTTMPGRTDTNTRMTQNVHSQSWKYDSVVWNLKFILHTHAVC